MRNISDQICRENQNIHFVFSNFFFSKIVPFMRKCGYISYRGASHRWQYEAFALHAFYLRLQTHTQVVLYSLLSHSNNGCTNAPQCYVIRIFAVLLQSRFTLHFIVT